MPARLMVGIGRENDVLKGIDPLLSPDLLHILASMGHGDEIVLVDALYPAVTNAQRLVRLPGSALPGAARAVLSILPLDTFIDQPMATMAMVDTPEVVPEVQQEVLSLAIAAEGREIGMEQVERFAFYERSRRAFAIVQTGELRPYGNVIFTKGVGF
jgi:L-fucose mutarotase